MLEDNFLCFIFLIFLFVDLFQRVEVVQWVNQGGGEMVNGVLKQNIHFTIECHGVRPVPADTFKTTYISSHWVRSCLEVCVLLP